jgi:hypothetical protein
MNKFEFPETCFKERNDNVIQGQGMAGNNFSGGYSAPTLRL